MQKLYGKLNKIIEYDFNNQNKITTSNGLVTPDEGYTGLSSVEVAVTPKTSLLNISTNGTYNATDFDLDGFNPVNVNVQPPLQEKIVTTNGEVTPDAPNYGLSKVNVAVVPNLLEGQVFDSNGIYPVPEGKDGFGDVVVDTPDETPDWVPPAEWPNIKFIIENDEKVADSKVICLLDNTDDSFTFTLVNAEGLTAVKFNDGTLYEGAGTYTHNFDPANDIIAGYERQRWYILYFNGDETNRILTSNMMLKNSILWLYFDRKTTANTDSLNSMIKVQRIQAATMGDIVINDYINLLQNNRLLVDIDLDETYEFASSATSYSFNALQYCYMLKRFRPKLYLTYMYSSSPMFSSLYSLEDEPNLKIQCSNVNYTGSNNVFGGVMPKIKKVTIDVIGFLRRYFEAPNMSSLKTIEFTDDCQIYSFDSMIYGSAQSIANLTNLLNVDFTYNTKAQLFTQNMSYKLTRVNNFTAKPETMLISSTVPFTNLTQDSMWQLVNCLKDRTDQTALTLTIPLELYQKMTAEMITAITNKNWTISTY